MKSCGFVLMKMIFMVD